MTKNTKDAVRIEAARDTAELLEAVTKAYGGKSVRACSKWLNWPRSLIPEVLAGRRALSIERAVQLAKKLHATADETERIVLMAVRDAASGATRQALGRLLLRGEMHAKAGVEDGNFHALPSVLIVLAQKLKRLPTYRELRRSFAFPESLTHERYKQAVQVIAKRSVTSVEDLPAYQDVVPVDPEGEAAALRIHRSYHQQYGRYLENSKGRPRALIGGICIAERSGV